VTLVVIDAAGGVEIVCDTRRGRALARLLPVGAEGWVPEHFYSEVLGVLRWQLLGQKLSESQASVAVGRLGGWHLRHASVAPLVQAAWSYRHNLTAADALYVVLHLRRFLPSSGETVTQAQTGTLTLRVKCSTS
jgi:predicted nucleic acid-binding protein